MEQKKLFLLDAYALIFRAYYAFISRPIKNSKGMNTSAIFGFVNTLDELLRKEKPSHIAVAFDPPSPVFRAEMYHEYKANRDESPEEIRASVPFIKAILKAYHIPYLEVSGFEADDVIGTLAKKAEAEGFTVYMMTPDKDFTQLISEHIYLFKPARLGGAAEVINLQNLASVFGVDKPEKVIDVLALWGDSVDNVPGAPGIGEKTAKALIATYGDIENLYANIDDLKGRQRENLIQYRQQVELSKKLVTIETNVPFTPVWDDFLVREPDKATLKQLFDELEFRTLINRIIGGATPPQTPANTMIQTRLFSDEETGYTASSTTESGMEAERAYKTIHDVPHQYYLADTPEKRSVLINQLVLQADFCFDTETTGLDTSLAELVGIAFSFKEHEGYYVPMPSDRKSVEAILQEFSFLFENGQIAKTGQNIKYDIQVLANYGIFVKGTLFDTMIAHYLLQPELRHNMDYIARSRLGYQPVPIEALIGEKGKWQLNMRHVEIEKITAYACEDADITWQLAGLLRQKLDEAHMQELAYGVEMPLVAVLAAIEQNGFKINTDALDEYAVKLKSEIALLEDVIYNQAGEQFNIASPKQLGDILFEKLNITDGAKKTKTKQYATNEEVLQQLTGKHPIVNHVLEYRGLKKLLNTYVEALPKLINPKTGRIHTSFDQAWVATGRLSSKNPNLQNIPIRDEKGREIRKAFIAGGEDYLLLSADYSQIELRLMAHLSGDPGLVEAFVRGEDIHTATAAKIYNIPLGEVSADMRRAAKTANFGIIYGISAFGLSQRLNIPRSEAKSLIDGYFSSYPGVRSYMEQSIIHALDKGYVETIMGRRRYLKDIRSANALQRGIAERNAINAPIQGSAADIIKKAMVSIHRELDKGFRTKMVLQVHDELVFDVYKPEIQEVQHLVKEKMEGAIKLNVPLTVDSGTGNNWLEAH